MAAKIPTVAKAIEACGGNVAVARAAGISDEGVRLWRQRGIPANRVIWLAKLSGWQFVPHELAPDIYPHPHDGLPAPLRNSVRRTPVEERAA